MSLYIFRPRGWASKMSTAAQREMTYLSLALFAERDRGLQRDQKLAWFPRSPEEKAGRPFRSSLGPARQKAAVSSGLRSAVCCWFFCSETGEKYNWLSVCVSPRLTITTGKNSVSGDKVSWQTDVFLKPQSGTRRRYGHGEFWAKRSQVGRRWLAAQSSALGYSRSLSQAFPRSSALSFCLHQFPHQNNKTLPKLNNNNNNNL